MVSKNAKSYYEQQLESDEDLPDDYTEERDIPSYLDDSRFDDVEFKWIDKNLNHYYDQIQSKKSVKFSAVEEEFLCKTKHLKPGENVLIYSSVLNEEDMYCLKSIEPFASDCIFLWLVNFLISKDLQADFKFLKSCLVEPILNINCDDNEDLQYSGSKQFHFDFITK